MNKKDYKRKSFVLHSWSISCYSKNDSLLNLLDSKLELYRANKTKRRPKKAIDIFLEEGFSDRIIEKMFYNPKYTCYWVAEDIFLAVSVKRQKAVVVFQNKPGLRLWNLILIPLSACLKKEKHTLIHGALVAKGTEGILIHGPSKVGKSTISLMAMEAGFKFLGDEHPILTRRAGKIVGKGFVSPLAIRPEIMNKIERYKTNSLWVPYRNKFELRPWEVYPKAMGKSCEIRAVVFPCFSQNKKIKLRKNGSTRGL